MTDFLPDEDVAAFAGEVREFLADNLTDEMRRRMHDTGTVHVPQLHADMAAHGWMATATSRRRARPSRTAWRRCSASSNWLTRRTTGCPSR